MAHSEAQPPPEHTCSPRTSSAGAAVGVVALRRCAVGGAAVGRAQPLAGRATRRRSGHPVEQTSHAARTSPHAPQLALSLWTGQRSTGRRRSASTAIAPGNAARSARPPGADLLRFCTRCRSRRSSGCRSQSWRNRRMWRAAGVGGGPCKASPPCRTRSRIVHRRTRRLPCTTLRTRRSACCRFAGRRNRRCRCSPHRPNSRVTARARARSRYTPRANIRRTRSEKHPIRKKGKKPSEERPAHDLQSEHCLWVVGDGLLVFRRLGWCVLVWINGGRTVIRTCGRALVASAQSGSMKRGERP